MYVIQYYLDAVSTWQQHTTKVKITLGIVLQV